MVMPEARTPGIEPAVTEGLMTMSDRTCTVDGCDGKYYAKTWCYRHYYRNYRTGSPLGRVKGSDPCSIEGCTVRASAKSLCPKHYLAEYNRITFQLRKQSKRLYYEQNRDAFLERAFRNGAIDRQLNPEKHRERNRLYAKSHPSVRRNSQERRRARKLDADVREFSDSDWQRLVRRFNHCCAYCGQRKPLTQDHVIPLSRGGRHAISNLLPACQSCNASKGNKFLIEWRRYRHIIRHII